MKKFITILILLSSSMVFAIETKEKTPATTPKKISEKKVAPDKEEPKWPRPYKTTEQISADSVVPFPSDI